jgi:hypothetical protein
LLLIATLIGVLGYLNQHSGLLVPTSIVTDFYANVSAELASIAITVLVIDTLNERRLVQQEKAALIFQMGSPTNSIAGEAIRMLRARGWLTDGSLEGANLSWANLEDAYLENANMPKVDLFRAKLKGAHLEWSNLKGARVATVWSDLKRARRAGDKQFAQTTNLRGATMPDGSQYDGRYNLVGDLRWARNEPRNTDDPGAMAEFYKVPLEVYLSGQTWAQQNLARLRGETSSEVNSTKSDDSRDLPAIKLNEPLLLGRPDRVSLYVLGVLAVSAIAIKLVKARFNS